MQASHIEDFFRHVAGLMPYPVFWMDLASTMLAANDAAAQMFGHPRGADVCGRQAQDLLPGAAADKLIAQVLRLRETVTMQRDEETVVDPHTGLARRFTVYRYPVFGTDGSMVGVFGTALEATAPTGVTTAADLGKLVAELKSVAPGLSSVARVYRSRFDNALRGLQDVVRQLRELSRCQATSADPDPFRHEAQVPVLLSGLVNQVCRAQQAILQRQSVSVHAAVSDSAQFGFVSVQDKRLQGAIGQLIGNAAVALQGKRDATILLRLDATEDMLTLTIQDNGHGLNFEMLDRMLSRKDAAPADIRSTGMAMVWDMLEQNRGVLNVDTIFDRGTAVQLAFPRSALPDWIATQVVFLPDAVVLVLDADPAVHAMWDRRLDIYRQLYPSLQVHHQSSVKDAQALLRAAQHGAGAQRVLLDGLTSPGDLVTLPDTAIGRDGNVILFTDGYADPVLQQRAVALGIRLAPRELAAILPLSCRDPVPGDAD